MTFFSFLRNLTQGRAPELVSQPQVKATVLTPSKPGLPQEQIEAESERLRWNDLELLQDVLQYYSGYFRQAAVERCEELRVPGSLPYVALRLNDWVPQVRQAARRAVLAMLDSANLDDRYATLEIVDGLRKAGRTDHGEWISEFEHKFLHGVRTEQLWNELENSSRKRARICFDLLRRHSLFPLERLLGYGVASKADIVLAIRCVEFAAQLPGPDRSAVLKLAMESHFGSVRRAALHSLLAHGEAGEIVNQCLLDKHVAVRSLAMSYLANRQVDLKGFYRSKLHAVSSPAMDIKVALLSLATLGSIEDLEAIKAHTVAASAVVRLAAYMGWLKLAPSEKDALVLQAFADTAPSIRKFALLAMERHGAYAKFSDLYEVLGPSDDLLKLMFTVRSHKWNWLAAIALLARSAPPNSRLAAGLALELRSWISNDRWMRHRPIGKQAKELSSPEVVRVLVALIAGEDGLIVQLREQIAQGTAAYEN